MPAPAQSAGAGEGGSISCLNWDIIDASPGNLTTNSPSDPEKSETGGAWVSMCGREAPSPGCQITGNRTRATLSRGSNEA